jgi:lysozyme
MAVRKTSAKGVNFIAQFEGFRSEPYNDPANNATIGYGHLLHTGPVTQADKTRWGTITRAHGLKLLADDLSVAENCVLKHVNPPFTFQNRFDALVSFVFNVGCGAFSTSTLLKDLNKGWTRRGAADEFLKWTHAGGVVLPGLVRRRKAERALFLYRRYS